MTDLKLRNLSNFRLQAGIVIFAALAPLIWAQASRQLQVEVGTNQLVSILARGVSYGEVLKALQKKLGWEIEIPPVADELQLSYVRVEASRPQIALTKLLEGSGLGYAFLGGVNGFPIVKVVVIPSTPREAKVAQDTAPPVNDNAIARTSLLPSAQAQAGTNVVATETALEVPSAPSTIPLVDAINVMGVPPGVSPADVGKAMKFPISDAAKIMGVPPGVSPADVGKTTTMPLPTGPGQHP